MLDFINVPFGYLISFLYSFTHSYAITLIIFAVVVKIVLFPLGIKQQKNSQKQASLRPKEERIRKKYAGRTDRVTQQKMQQEIMELYQEEKFSPFGGCLPMLVQLVVVLCLYSVVTSPLKYVARLQPEQITQAQEIVQTMQNSTTPPAETPAEGEGAPASSTAAPQQSNSYYVEIMDTQYINNNKEAFIQAYNAKHGEAAADAFVDRIPELKLFGTVDLGKIPSNAGLISIPTLFALVSLLSAYFSQILTRKFTYQPVNDAANQGSMKIMNFVMPLFSGYISYTMVPIAVTIYWIAQNLLSPLQQIVLSKMYKIPTFTPEELKAAEKALEKNEPKKRKDDSLPKRRSLVYDDDEDEVASAQPEEKKGPKEKKKPDASPVEKAPLKEEAVEETAKADSEAENEKADDVEDK